MKIFCRLLTVVAGLGIPAATGFLVSCGGDNSSPAPETDSGGADSTLEAAPDVQNQEGASDVSPDNAATSDSTVDGGLDGSSSDGDATTEMADGDANTAAVPDAASDVLEAAADAPADVVDNSALYAFPNQVAVALCNQTSNCCFPDASAAFNFALCQADQGPQGFQGSSQGAAFLDGGNVLLDPAKASACLNDIASIDCRTNQLTSADMTALFGDCFGAMTGKLPAGSVCRNSIECEAGLFCDTLDGGTPMTCQSVRSAGASCSDFGTPLYPGAVLESNAQSTCSNRGSGNTGLACQFYLPVTFDQPDGGWFCQPAAANGTPCTQNLNCTSKLCTGSPSACAAVSVFAPPATCSAFMNPDGG